MSELNEINGWKKIIRKNINAGEKESLLVKEKRNPRLETTVLQLYMFQKNLKQQNLPE
jgi:hypothetical protein